MKSIVHNQNDLGFSALKCYNCEYQTLYNGEVVQLHSANVSQRSHLYYQNKTSVQKKFFQKYIDKITITDVK